MIFRCWEPICTEEELGVVLNGDVFIFNPEGLYLLERKDGHHDASEISDNASLL